MQDDEAFDLGLKEAALDRVYAVLYGSGTSVMGVHRTREEAQRHVRNNQNGDWDDNEWSIEEYVLDALPAHDTPAWRVLLMHIQGKIEWSVEPDEWPLKNPGEVHGNWVQNPNPWWTVSVYAETRAEALNLGMELIGQFGGKMGGSD